MSERRKRIKRIRWIEKRGFVTLEEVLRWGIWVRKEHKPKRWILPNTWKQDPFRAVYITRSRKLEK